MADQRKKGCSSCGPREGQKSVNSGSPPYIVTPRGSMSNRPVPNPIGEPRARSSAIGCAPEVSPYDAIYEMDPSVIEEHKLTSQGYAISIKHAEASNIDPKPTVMEHFHQLMKDTLGEKVYTSLLKKGIISKNLPDEIVTRKILDTLELKNKFLFASDPTVTAIDKIGLIQAAGSLRGALRAAINATTDIDDEKMLEGIAEREVLEYQGLYPKKKKPKPEITVLGYIGVTKN